MSTESRSAELPGHPHLRRESGRLMLEGVALDDLAERWGTPLFAYSATAIRHALGAYQQALAGRPHRVCYAMKANPSLGILRLLAAMDCGFDIVSGGELARVIAAGADPRRVIFSGVGKTEEEMRQALQAGIACFNVESEAELEVLASVARSCGRVAPVSVRVNPNVDPKTHPYISTGLKGSKFGVAHERTLDTYRRAASLPGLKVVGIDCHIGSQITDEGPYLDATERMLDLVDALEAEGIAIAHIDFGGGLGINYRGDRPPAPAELWARLLARIDARGHGNKMLMIEPGRSLVGNAGVCITRVLYLKPGEQKNYCIVDAAMNDLPRPAMYQAYHGIEPVIQRTDGSDTTWEVVGPVCESGDWLGHDRQLALAQGDLLAVLSAGAYCMSMASNYNSRPRAAEVLVDADSTRLIRRRESLDDQLRAELDACGSA